MLLLFVILLITLFTSTTTSVTVSTQEQRRLEGRISHATCCDLAAQHIPILRAWNEACQHVPCSTAVERAMRNKFISLTHLNDNKSNLPEEDNYSINKSTNTITNFTDEIEKLCDDNNVSDSNYHLHESAIELYIRGSVFCSSLPQHHKELVHSAAFVPLVEAFPSEEDLIVDRMEATCKEIQENRGDKFHRWVNAIVMSFKPSQKLQNNYTSITEVQNMLCDAPCKQIVDEFGEWRYDL